MTVYLPLEQPAVVVSPFFLAQYPVDMTLGENDFSVKDVNGTIIFRIKSKLMSLHDRRKLLDANNNVLVSMSQKLMTAHRRWKAYRGDSKDDKDLLFTVKKSSMLQLKTELAVFLAGNTKEEVPDFRVKGSFNESSCVIYLGNTNKIIAQSMATMLFEADNFRVTIYPNVDYAFIVSLVVILDEINADRSGED
ncbi:Protein LURP-one-related 15 [Linum perenne]